MTATSDAAAAVAFRRAEPADAETLAALGRRTFVEKFGPLYDPKDLQTYLDNDHDPAVYRRFMETGRTAVFMAERAADRDAVGYAVAGPCSMEAFRSPRAGELYRLYVDAQARNLGVGRRLFDMAFNWLKTHFDAYYLSVFSENEGAQRFYQRLGFDRVGEHHFMVGAQADLDYIFQYKDH